MPPKKSSPNKSPLSHGGERQGAGRKYGSGSFGEETKVVRVPKSRVSDVKQWLEKLKQGYLELTISDIRKHSICSTRHSEYG